MVMTYFSLTISWDYAFLFLKHNHLVYYRLIWEFQVANTRNMLFSYKINTSDIKFRLILVEHRNSQISQFVLALLIKSQLINLLIKLVFLYWHFLSNFYQKHMIKWRLIDNWYANVFSMYRNFYCLHIQVH